MESREEILKKYGLQVGFKSTYNWDDILKAMSEYSQRKTFEEFDGLKEMFKAAKQNAIELQEAEEREEYNRGQEDAYEYALQLIDECQVDIIKSVQGR